MTVACYTRAILNFVAWQQVHTLNKSDCAYFIIRHDLLKLNIYYHPELSK